MAYYYYPEYYDHSHLLQHYSQSLFNAVPPHTYTDYPNDHHQDHHSGPGPVPTTHNTSNGPLFSSLPSSSSSPPHEYEYPPTTSPRARSTTPPAPPANPSPSYIDFASKPSKTLSEPTRKLLVLDLNGTLLLRSPRPPRSFRSGQHQHQPSHPAPRRVMRRPYLTALRAYLFAPQTRAWLDVMVWSSAQPHSVEDMVAHALENDREWLVAIWARDTLGLTGNHYHRKVQTIKDLEKPWAALTPQHSRPASPPYSPSVAAPRPQPRSSSPEWTGHSAATTILLDDSHAKASLQPHNHLCVPEYTRAQRNVDLVALKQHADQQQSVITSCQEDSATHAPDGTTTEKVHKRKKRKRAEAQAQLQSADGAPAAAAAAAEATFDETLLAVIGILHAARLQSSVAGWLRASALFQPLSKRGDDDGTKTWCDDPVLVRAWASRGREAMHELGLKVEHGVEP